MKHHLSLGVVIVFHDQIDFSVLIKFKNYFYYLIIFTSFIFIYFYLTNLPLFHLLQVSSSC